MSGPDVKAVKEGLNRRDGGCSPKLTEKEIFDDDTAAAVRKYQAEHGAEARWDRRPSNPRIAIFARGCDDHYRGDAFAESVDSYTGKRTGAAKSTIGKVAAAAIVFVQRIESDTSFAIVARYLRRRLWVKRDEQKGCLAQNGRNTDRGGRRLLHAIIGYRDCLAVVLIRH